MLSQGDSPAPLTEENLKKHQRQTARHQTSLKDTIARQASFRSAGDGESIDFVSDETILKHSLHEEESNEKEAICDDKGKQESNSANIFVLEDMSKREKTRSPKNLTQKDTNLKINQPSGSENASDKSLEVENKKFESEDEGNSVHADRSASESIENDGDSEEDSDSSSSVDSDIDSVITKDNKTDEENEDSSKDTARTSRSSSSLVEDDNEDDDDDDDDDDDEDDESEEEEQIEDEKSEDALTHYTSSLNASMSSIPTIYDDTRDITPLETPNREDESFEENQEENVEREEENKVVGEETNINEEEEVKVEEEIPLETQPPMSDHEEDNYTPPGSRQVSGRSATPLTVVASEFDEVESTIFDRRELSPPCSSQRDKLTPSENSGNSEVTIKNWAGFGQEYVTSKGDSTQSVALNNHVNAKNKKRLKSKKARDAKRHDFIEKNYSTNREQKNQPSSKRKSKRPNVNSRKGGLVRQTSLSSNDSDVDKQQRVKRRKKRPVKQVSFAKSQTEDVAKTNTSDSAFNGSRTESRGEEGQPSPRPPKSEQSDRGSSRWSAAETERASSTGTRPVSTAQSPRSYFSSSRQTSFVEEVTFANYAPIIRGKRKQLPSLRGPTKPRNKKSQSATSKMTTKTAGGESSMMRRVLSANKHKVSRLANIMEELQQEVEELKLENRSLKRVSHRQEREIRKIDEEEAALPVLLQRHSAEMRTLKERLKKNQEVLHRKEKESQDRDHEIQKLRDKVKSYRELSQEKKLGERAALAKKLENVENEVALKDKKIMELEKAISLKDKARQREMKEQKDRYKHAKEELQRVQEDFRSLRERLQEKEKELDEKNIYHYQITKQKKKGATLPALPAGPQAPAISAPVIHASKSANTQEKRANVFLTNAPSDTGSVLTDEAERSFKVEVRQDKPAVSEAAKPIVLEANKGDKDGDDRLRVDAEERSRVDEEERRRRLEEEELKRRDEKERTRREEEEKRKAEEERRRREEEEKLNKQRQEEEERLRKHKEEEERKRFEEDAEVRRKKDLLLARMRAIDTGNDKPDSGVTVGHTAADPPVDNKPKKLPIFLQSDQPEPQKAKPAPKSVASDDDVFSDIGGDRKKRSSARSKHSGYSYDFKQTVENLHHGLPAHVSLENIKDQSAKVDGKDSLSDDLSFGSYKPTLGRRAAAKRDSREKDELSFGGYNPSFGAKKDTTRKNSGLDFGTGKKAIPQKEQNAVIFGDYKPTLGGVPTKTASTQQNGDIFGDRDSQVRNRRTRGFASKGASVFGDDLFENDNPKPTGEPLFGDKSLNKDKSSYPWENKVDVTRKNSEGDSLLPRRRVHLQQNVRAVNNALGDIDDEIEEVIL